MLIQVVTGQAQEYLANVQHFGLTEGLSHREIFAVHQDSRGFIWLGTKYGLNRFDGREFKWWTKERQGLASNEIHHILEDVEGYLWVLTVPSWYHSDRPMHISLVNIHSGKVQSLKQKFGDELPFSEEEILKIISNKDHTLIYQHQKKNPLFLSFSARISGNSRLIQYGFLPFLMHP